MIPQQTIQQAVARIVEAARPSKVILFGSWCAHREAAKGDAHAEI